MIVKLVQLIILLKESQSNLLQNWYLLINVAFSFFGAFWAVFNDHNDFNDYNAIVSPESDKNANGHQSDLILNNKICQKQ